MTFKLSTPLLAALALTATLASLSASAADLPGRHPAYLHALTDLRDARWNLEHRPGDARVSGQEDVAITETDRAIGEAKKAAAEDGKNEADHPHEDAALDRPGRLHHALDLLQKAHADVHEEEDNPESRAMRGRIDQHVALAIKATQRAIHDVEQHR
jgi:hypothetical protein